MTASSVVSQRTSSAPVATRIVGVTSRRTHPRIYSGPSPMVMLLLVSASSRSAVASSPPDHGCQDPTPGRKDSTSPTLAQAVIRSVPCSTSASPCPPRDQRARLPRRSCGSGAAHPRCRTLRPSGDEPCLARARLSRWARSRDSAKSRRRV